MDEGEVKYLIELVSSSSFGLPAVLVSSSSLVLTISEGVLYRKLIV